MKSLQIGVLVLLVLGIAPMALAQDEAQVRVAQLSPDAPPIDVWVDGERVLADLAFKTISDYLALTGGDHRVLGRASGAAANPVLFEFRVSVTPGEAYTLVIAGRTRAGELQTLLVQDDLRLDFRQAKARFLNVLPDAPPLDVVIISDGGEGPLLFRNVGFSRASEYVLLPPGVYDLEVRRAGTETPLMRVKSAALDAGENYTLFAVGLLEEGTQSLLVLRDAPAVRKEIPIEIWIGVLMWAALLARFVLLHER